MLSENRITSELNELYSQLVAAREDIVKNGSKESDRINADLLKYLLKQIQLFKNNWKDSIEVCGFVCRCSFETLVIVKWLVKDKENYDIFFAATAFDKIDLCKAMLELPVEQGDSEKEFLDYIESMEKALVGLGYLKYRSRSKSLMNFRELSKEVELEEKYLSIFKLSSKMIHPTAWSINRNVDPMEDLNFTNSMYLNTKFFISEVLSIFEKIYQESFAKPI